MPSIILSLEAQSSILNRIELVHRDTVETERDLREREENSGMKMVRYGGGGGFSKSS